MIILKGRSDLLGTVKLLRPIFYVIVISTFFSGALIRVINRPDLVAGLYIVCAFFYVFGVSTDIYLFIQEWREQDPEREMTDPRN